MFWQRFDNSRLRPVQTHEVSARHCPGTADVIQACRLGAGPATRPLLMPWIAPHIEWPFGVLHVAQPELALRACLLLDGSWRMADAVSPAARWAERLRAIGADAAWWRPLAAQDAWDAGLAISAATLHGFRPRRASLIVLQDTLIDESWAKALTQLAQQSSNWPRAVRVLLAGGPAPHFARQIVV